MISPSVILPAVCRFHYCSRDFDRKPLDFPHLGGHVRAESPAQRIAEGKTVDGKYFFETEIIAWIPEATHPHLIDKCRRWICPVCKSSEFMGRVRFHPAVAQIYGPTRNLYAVCLRYKCRNPSKTQHPEDSQQEWAGWDPELLGVQPPEVQAVCPIVMNGERGMLRSEFARVASPPAQHGRDT